MESPKLVLTALAPIARTWTSTSQLRIGRLPDLEVVIDDWSVSRRHAEVALAEAGWIVRDFGSTNGTHLNGVRIGRTPQRVRQGDVVRVGNIDLRVDVLRGRPAVVRIGDGEAVQVEVAAGRTWDEAVDGFAPADDRWQLDGNAFLRLMRAGYRLAHSMSPDEQLQRILDEAVQFFGAQRGGIFLADDTSAQLGVRCTTIAPGGPGDRVLSRTPATRAFAARRSLLFKDCQRSPELHAAGSVARGGMGSIVCAVLRSPDRAFGVLHLDRGLLQDPFTEADLYLADSLAAALALGVERLQMVDRQQELFLHTVTALAQAVEMRDPYTGDHTYRVTMYSMILAEELGIPAEQRQLLRAAAALHDVGKIAIDDQVLRKPGRLSEAESAQMKTHVTRGAEIIQMVPGLAWALPVVRGHHERWDGTGYPDRLSGEGIPLPARIVAVADAFDAMTSDRPYRPGMSAAVAFAELQAGSGKQFDPRCVVAFLRARPRIEALMDQETVFRRRAESAMDTISARELQLSKTEKALPLPPGTGTLSIHDPGSRPTPMAEAVR